MQRTTGRSVQKAWGPLWSALVAGLLIFGLFVPSSAAAKKTRDYGASIAPIADTAEHADASYVLNISNQPSSDVELASANITVPAGYSAVSLGAVAASAGKTWTAALAAGVIQLRAASGTPPPGETTNALAAGESVTLTVTATAPCASGTYTWATQAKEGLGFTGANFSRVGPDPTVAIAGNCAPAIAADQATVTVNEGQTAANTGTYADSNPGDSVAVTASTGTITKTGTSSGTWGWSLTAVDGPASDVITVTADDGQGGVVTTTFSLTVRNVAPTVSIQGAPATSPEGVTIALTSTVDDPGILDTFTYTWTVTLMGLPYASGSRSSLEFTPSSEGTYIVSLEVADDDGGTASDSRMIEVIHIGPIVVATYRVFAPLILR